MCMCVYVANLSRPGYVARHKLTVWLGCATLLDARSWFGACLVRAGYLKLVIVGAPIGRWLAMPWHRSVVAFSPLVAILLGRLFVSARCFRVSMAFVMDDLWPFRRRTCCIAMLWLLPFSYHVLCGFRILCAVSAFFCVTL